MNTNIRTLNDDEVLEVNGGILQLLAAAAALIYIGGELHDALCDDHN